MSASPSGHGYAVRLEGKRDILCQPTEAARQLTLISNASETIVRTCPDWARVRVERYAKAFRCSLLGVRNGERQAITKLGRSARVVWQTLEALDTQDGGLAWYKQRAANRELWPTDGSELHQLTLVNREPLCVYAVGSTCSRER